jgi:hypothetical protein
MGTELRLYLYTFFFFFFFFFFGFLLISEEFYFGYVRLFSFIFAFHGRKIEFQILIEKKK